MLKQDHARGADDGGAASDGVTPGRASTRAIQRKASGGAPLPAAPRAQMEASLGTDLGAVRVHDDTASHAAAAGLHANAYTTGSDIHFAEGTYAPDDPFGLHLLAHEVAHTVQQGGGHEGVQRQLAVGASTDGAELEADRFADHIVHGTDQPALSPTGLSIQRQEATGTPSPAETPTATADPNQAFYAEVSAVVAAMLAEYQALAITVPIAPPAAAAETATPDATATATATATPDGAAAATATATATPTATPTAVVENTTAYVDVPYWNNNYPKHNTDQATGDVPPDAYWSANDGIDDASTAEDDGSFRRTAIRAYDGAVPADHETRDDHFHTVQNDNAMVAKGSPADIRLLLETAIANHVIAPPTIPGTNAGQWATAWKNTLQDWMAKAGVGVDCSGLVYSTLRAIQQRVTGARTSGDAGTNGILDAATASGADVPMFGSMGTPVTNWFTIQPGDTMTIPGHVRIVMTVEERTDTLIRFTTSESTPNPSAEPGSDTYEGPRWHEWIYQVTPDGVVRQQRYVPGGPLSAWDENPDNIIISSHIAPPS